MYVSVTDAAGNPVRNADPKTFQLQENGQAMQLVAATRSGDQGPVSTVLVVDRTGSMASADKMAGAKQAAATFVNLMRPGDHTALVQFDTEIDTLQPLTDDKSALLASIQKIFPRGNTALYDAIAKAGAYFENVQGRKAVIVVTDGMDNASKLNRDALVKQAGTAGYSIYTIGLGAKGAGYGSQDGIDEAGLQDIAAASYGTYAYAPDASQLNGLYQQLSLKIQNEYRLSYLTPIALRDGVKRNIVVTAPGAAAAQTAYNPGGIHSRGRAPMASMAALLCGVGALARTVLCAAGCAGGARTRAGNSSTAGPATGETEPGKIDRRRACHERRQHDGSINPGGSPVANQDQAAGRGPQLGALTNAVGRRRIETLILSGRSILRLFCVNDCFYPQSKGGFYVSV